MAPTCNNDFFLQKGKVTSAKANRRSSQKRKRFQAFCSTRKPYLGLKGIPEIKFLRTYYSKSQYQSKSQPVVTILCRKKAINDSCYPIQKKNTRELVNTPNGVTSTWRHNITLCCLATSRIRTAGSNALMRYQFPDRVIQSLPCDQHRACESAPNSVCGCDNYRLPQNKLHVT